MPRLCGETASLCNDDGAGCDGETLVVLASAPLNCQEINKIVRNSTAGKIMKNSPIIFSSLCMFGVPPVIIDETMTDSTHSSSRAGRMMNCQKLT